LPGADDILSEQVAHQFEGVPIVHGNEFHPVSIGNDFSKILAGAIKGGNSQVFKGVLNVFGVFFHDGNITV
jgi:hypothetical protein